MLLPVLILVYFSFSITSFAILGNVFKSVRFNLPLSSSSGVHTFPSCSLVPLSVPYSFLNFFLFALHLLFNLFSKALLLARLAFALTLFFYLLRIFPFMQIRRRSARVPTSLSLSLALPAEAVARVLPAPEVHVQLGSRLEVTCQVEGCPPPALISWTREGQPVLTPDSSNYDLANGNATTPIASLTLARPHAEARDSGSYSCSSKCTTPVNVTVHVLRG